MSDSIPVRLAISHYLRTLRERDEFDRLLPELLTEMGYIPLVRPKAGVRQFGVDFPAAGRSSRDGVEELLLFVIKQGDIGRRTWDADPNAVRQSMDEVIDVYLRSHIPAAYANHRIVIVVATTGDMGQEVQQNWSGFTSRHPALRFEFWGADRVAELVEVHLLNEHLFDAQDRSDLRKSLVLAGDEEYRFEDLCRLMLRQLGLDAKGQLTADGTAQDAKALVKAMRRVHLAAQICAYWADTAGERCQALWVMERTVLWTFHRAFLQGAQSDTDVAQALQDFWTTYLQVARLYHQRVANHARVKDGMSGYCREGAEYAVTLHKHIGLLASIGLAHALAEPANPDAPLLDAEAVGITATLAALVRNHAGAASPRLDGNAIDISLALVLLCLAGRYDVVRWWLSELASRLNFSFASNRMFPVGTDSLDDLVELDVGAIEDFKTRLKHTSWMLAVIASWCAMLELDEAYGLLAKGHAEQYQQVGPQLWHPAHNWSQSWYFGPGHDREGSTEAPYPLPLQAETLRARIAQFNALGRLKWEENSPSLPLGLWALDFVACRHFRTPVPASMWYRISDRSPGTEVNEILDAGRTAT